MDQKSRIAAKKLRFTVVMEPPLSEIFLKECDREDRDMASMIRVILKRYFVDRSQAYLSDLPRPVSTDIPHYEDQPPRDRERVQGFERQ